MEKKTWGKGIYKSKHITRTWGKHRRHHKRCEEKILRQRFEAAQLQLQSDCQNPIFQEELSEARVALQAYDIQQAKWMDDILQQRWIRGRDKCSQIFFSTFKKKSSEIEFFELLNIEGAILKDWEDIADKIIAYFTNAFCTRKHGDQSSVFDSLLREQDARILAKARERLEQLPTLEDLRKAATCLNKLRSPGPDDVLVEFYITLWELVEHLLHKILLDDIQEGHFNPVFVRGIIVLMPKLVTFNF